MKSFVDVEHFVLTVHSCEFVTCSSAWVYDDMIWSYVENKDKYSTPPRPSHSFQEAVDAIEGYIKEFGHQPPVSCVDSDQIVHITIYNFYYLLLFVRI